MKDTLQSQLITFKKDNTESSKEEMFTTLESLTSYVNGNKSMMNSVEVAKKALTTDISNKDEIVQSVENVISGLE